jgi:hypothetical protein
MKFKNLLAALTLAVLSTSVWADNVLIIDAQYNNVNNNVKSRLEAAGHTVTITTNTSLVPTGTDTYQQVWDLRYANALTGAEVTNYTSFITAGGFAYFVTENPGCCMARNNSVAQLVTGLGGGSTQIGPGWANNVNTNLNTVYMTQGITVNYLAVAAIVNAQGIPLIRDANNNVSGMSWIGRAGALSSGVTGTIVTVADVNWLSEAWGAQNQQALDDIITGIVAGTVGGTISAQGNGAAASNGAAQQQNNTPSTFDRTDANQVVSSATMAAGTFTGNGGALQAVNGSATIANDITLTASGMILDSNGQNVSMTGTVSGVGGLTFTNTSTGGATTLNGTYTYTGPTTVNNSATVINNSNISSSSLLTNLGTFTNSSTGRAGIWVNGFNGDGNTAVLNNAGILGNGLNYSTFNNTGTVGNFTNIGTTNNTGTAGVVQNSGVLNNNAGGTIAELGYNNHVVNNGGTITTVTYNGGTVNNTGTIGSINNSEAHGTFHNTGTVSGTVTTNSTFNNYAGGTVIGLYTNNGALNNAGTMGDWLNNSTVTNTGTMANGTNNGTFTNSGAVGNTVNTGTFTNTGSIGSLTNSGTFTSGLVTLGTYTQTSTGSTSLPYGSVITSTGPAVLDGSLTMTGTPYTLGKYNVLTGNGVSGTFSSYNGVGVLRYTPSGVQIWVMPDGTIVQARVDNVASNLSSMNSLASSSMISSLGSDCTVFGDKGGCISFNYGQSKAGTGDLQTAGATVAKRFNPNWRVGVFLGHQLNDASIGAVKYQSNNPAVGGFVGWNKNSDGIGLGIIASAIQGTGNYNIGGNSTGVKGEAVQVRASYTLPLNETTSISPYVGIRQSSFAVNGYTEQGEIFPLTYSAVNQTSTDVLAGTTVSKKLTDKLTANLSLGIIQQVNSSAGTLNSTSDMGNYSAPLTLNKNTTASVGAGVSYAVAKNQRIGANVGLEQRQLGNVSSVGVNYTVGF